MNRWLIGGLLLLAAGALAIRLPQLDRRPFHTDESVHTLKFRDLMDRGFYRFDPHEYHGPTLYYVTLPVVWASGARTFADSSEIPYRLVPVLFGTGLILLLPLFRPGLSRAALLWAGLMTAGSPAMVFYSRYYIHELILVAATMVLLGAVWRYAQKPGFGWALLAGASLGLMHATKETFVLAAAALGLALALTWAWTRWVEGAQVSLAPYGQWRHWLAGAGLAVVVSVLWFSSFLTNFPQGPLDSIRTYFPWAERAGGQSPHVHPWHYYLGLLIYTQRAHGPVWTEALILALAVVGIVAGLRGRGLAGNQVGFVRLLSFYSLSLTAIYSAIAYKTPWCLLGFHHGYILLAGVGAAVLADTATRTWLKGLVYAALLAGVAHLGWQAYRASFRYETDPRNPYVYAQTLPNLVSLARKLDNLAKVHPRGHDLLVRVMATGGDYWPLPWYLRRFNQVGYYAEVPDAPAADVIVSSPTFAAKLAESLKETHQTLGFFGHRPRVFLVLTVEKSLWAEYLKSPREDED